MTKHGNHEQLPEKTNVYQISSSSCIIEQAIRGFVYPDFLYCELCAFEN